MLRYQAAAPLTASAPATRNAQAINVWQNRAKTTVTNRPRRNAVLTSKAAASAAVMPAMTKPAEQPPAVQAAALAPDPIPDRTRDPIRVRVRGRIRAAAPAAVPAKRITEYAKYIQTARRGTNVATAAMNAENANPAVIWAVAVGQVALVAVTAPRELGQQGTAAAPNNKTST